MIEWVMLIMLGFFIGGLVALLLAPTLWRRAVRLTTRRIEATMPMSLSDIEADKDMLRASYAIQIRKLETSLEKAREKIASQTIELSKLQMEIARFQEQIGGVQRNLDERSNAASVFEKTLKRRFPELEAQLAAARTALNERGAELTDLRNKLARKDEAVALAQQATNKQQAEIRQLREALERRAAEHAGRSKKSSGEWTLEEFRAEYDHLSLELSKLREQVAVAHEREGHQTTALKTEMQQLAEQIMTTVSNQESAPSKGEMFDSVGAQTTQKPPEAERSLMTPRPWPKEQISQ
jgi:chromosome segregation ATPase